MSEITGSVKKFYPQAKYDNRAKLLLYFLLEGTIHGVDEIAAMKETHVSFGKERFKVWNILTGLDVIFHQCLCVQTNN